MSKKAPMSECTDPKCPKCGTNRQTYPDGDNNWWCADCGICFDTNPDEGGDYSTDPTRTLRNHKRRDRQPRSHRSRH